MTLSNEELLARLVALEEKVAKSNLMMKRKPEHNHYEKLVDVVCDHDKSIDTLKEKVEDILHVPASGYRGLRLEEIQE